MNSGLWAVVPLRSVRAARLHGHTESCAPGGVHSPDCEELDPSKRQVRRKPKQHRAAVVGFIVVLGKYPPFKFTCPAAYPSSKQPERMEPGAGKPLQPVSF